MLIDRQGYSIRFQEEEIRSTGRNSKGVNSIGLRQDDVIADIDIITPDKISLLSEEEDTKGKHLSFSSHDAPRLMFIAI